MKETFNLARYTVRKESPSHFAAGVTVDEEVGIRCPQCAATMFIVGHGGGGECPGCGVFYATYGNALILSDKSIDDARRHDSLGRGRRAL